MKQMHVFRPPLVGDKGDDSAVAPGIQRETGLFPGLPQEAVLRALPFLELAPDSDPLVMIEVVLFLHAMEHQIRAVPFDIAEGGISHVESACRHMIFLSFKNPPADTGGL